MLGLDQRMPDRAPAGVVAFFAHRAPGDDVGHRRFIRRREAPRLLRSLFGDFDKGSWLLDALAYLEACHAHGVPATLERSRSGNGGHVWVFFQGMVAATDARALGAALLR